MAPLAMSHSKGSAILGEAPCSLPSRYSFASPAPLPRPAYVMATWVQRPRANGVRFTTTRRLLKSGFLSEAVLAGFHALSAPKTPRRKWRGLAFLGEAVQVAASVYRLSVSLMGGQAARPQA